MTCYHTGKVQIGRCYIAAPPAIYGDSLAIQKALLNRRSGGVLERLIAAIWRRA